MEKFITDIINEWDPIDLFPFAPQDEYKCEINSIINLISYTTNINDIAIGIHSIFTKSFGDDVFKKSLLDCMEIAKSIQKNL